MRRTQQQPYAEPIFELRNCLRHRGLTDTQLLRSAGKRTAVYYTDEAFHRRESVHLSSLPAMNAHHSAFTAGGVDDRQIARRFDAISRAISRGTLPLNIRRVLKTGLIYLKTADRGLSGPCWTHSQSECLGKLKIPGFALIIQPMKSRSELPAKI